MTAPCYRNFAFHLKPIKKRLHINHKHFSFSDTFIPAIKAFLFGRHFLPPAILYFQTAETLPLDRHAVMEIGIDTI